MNETQINAQFNVLVEQRNSALNSIVNMAGELAVLKDKVTSLEKQLEAATALVSESAAVA
jgi:hypothetical protein